MLTKESIFVSTAEEKRAKGNGKRKWKREYKRKKEKEIEKRKI